MKNMPSVNINRSQLFDDGKSDRCGRISISEFSLEDAKQKLVFWNDITRTSVRFQKGEPPLSLILGLLLFKHEQEGFDLEGHRRNPLHQEIHAFFTQVRIRRVLKAVSSGEADGRVSNILQGELNKTGGYGPIWSQMPLFLYHQAYLKIRILECFAKNDLMTTPTARSWKGYPGNLFSSSKFPLAELLALPLRDPFHERDHDFA
jgi:hypothetical protein